MTAGAIGGFAAARRGAAFGASTGLVDRPIGGAPSNIPGESVNHFV